MHIPSLQSLICLSVITVPYVSAVPLDESLLPRAASRCNANDLTTLKHTAKQPEQYCKSWLASKHTKSTAKGLSVAQVSSVCKCVQASASSSSVAAAKKTAQAKVVKASSKKITSTKKTTSTKRATTSAKKTTTVKAKAQTTSTKKTTLSKKTTTSAKKSSSVVKPVTPSKASTSIKKALSTAKSSSQSRAQSKKPTSSSHSTSSSTTSRVSSSHVSVSASSTANVPSSVSSSAEQATTGVTSHKALASVMKAAVSASTGSSSSGTASSGATATSSASASSYSRIAANDPQAQNIIVNGNFSGGSFASWYATRAVGTKFSVSSLDNDGNNQALIQYDIPSNGNAAGEIFQNVTIPAGMSYQLILDVYLNYPNGLPQGVTCVVKYSLGGDTNIMNQYGVNPSSGSKFSDSASGQTTSGFTGPMQISTYCNSVSSSESSFALGFGNIQLLVSPTPAATSTSSSAVAAATTTTGSAPAASSSAASQNNIIYNGDFNTATYSGWNLFRLGSTAFTIQGSPGAYVSNMNFTAGGDANSQAALMQQAVNVTSGKIYTLNMGLLLDYPSALPNDGSQCTLQVYIVDQNGYGIVLAQTSYGYGDAAFQTVTGSGMIDQGFSGYFDILIRCYGGQQPIVAGVEDIQVFESS